MTAPQAATKAILAQDQSYDAAAQSNVDITRVRVLGQR